MTRYVTFLRSLRLDAVIGWNQGVELKAQERAERARRRHLHAQAAWNELNPHPFNRHPCLIHLQPDVIRCPKCHPLAEEAS